MDPAPNQQFAEAIKRFDAENACDPNFVIVGGIQRPRELVYAEWLTTWIRRLSPEPSEALLLAARSQHLCRWMIPRNAYEPTRDGYLRWREDLKKFHAARAAGILREVGYPEEMIQRVHALNLKTNRAGDPECQTLEDALCLVTLEHQLEELIEKTAPEKMAGILQKTWRKMSEPARQQALQLPLSPRGLELCRAAGLVS